MEGGMLLKNFKWLKAYLLFIGAEAGAGEKNPELAPQH